MKELDSKLLALGALLHDIGKFRMRAEQRPTGKDHSQWGGEWLESFETRGLPKGVCAFAYWHHRKGARQEIESSNFTAIVDQADNYAAGSEREEKEEQAQFGNENVPLISIFSRIQLENLPKPSPVYHPIQEFKRNLLFPKFFKTPEEVSASGDVGVKAYQALWEKFEKEFELWCQNGCHVAPLLSLLERYTSFIPSETERIADQPETYPDISLYDHLKSTCAISLCLYFVLNERFPERFENEVLLEKIRSEEAKYFLLVGGDLSGVQKFIYTVGSKGALKILRAKSFFIELFIEHTVSQLLAHAGVTRANVVYIGGGRFYLLLPNTQKIHERIDQIRENANHYLWEHFRGKLHLILEALEFSGKDFKEKQMGKLWGELAQKLNESKRRRYEGQVGKLLQPQDPFLLEGVCNACYRDDVEVKEEREERFCESCARFLHMGEVLPRAKYVLTSQDPLPPNIEDYPIFGENKEKLFWFVFSEHLTAPWKAEFPVFQIHPTEEIHYKYKIPELILLSSGVYTRKEKAILDSHNNGESTASLELLAEQARGKKAIAGLRMDVDHLGQIFAKGLPQNLQTFTRMAMLSRQLTVFFKQYLPVLLEGKNVPEDFPLMDFSGKNPRENGRNIHTIYAGGDDLFLIGAWDEIAEVAIDIHEAFSRFTGYNPSLTLSGGFVIQRYDYPIYHLAELAHEAEQAAKENGRDSLSLFYSRELEKAKEGKIQVVSQTLKWKEVEEYVIDPLITLLALTKNGENANEENEKTNEKRRLSRGDIQKFFQIIDCWERKGILYLPHLAYLLARIKNFKKDSPEFCSQLMKPEYLPKIRNALVWLDLLLRKENIVKE